VIQTADGGYILGGWSNSDISGDKTQPYWSWLQDYWIVKIDSLGNKQWDKVFGGIGIDNLYTMIQTSDGGYLLGGVSSSPVSGDKTQPLVDNFLDYWIVKIDALGNKEWDKDFGAAYHSYLYSLYKTKDGGYLLGGFSESNAFGDKTENNMGTVQSWVIKTDSSGNKLWDKTVLSNGPNNINGLAIQSRDGCYVIVNSDYGGGIGGDKSQPSQGTYDYWIIKFCEDTINVVQPTSSFTSSDSVFCSVPAKCLNFYDHSIGNPTRWEWYFPGAVPNTSAFRNPFNICYYTPGTYPVTLISTNHAGSDTQTVWNMITVGGTPPIPTITVVGGDTLVCSHASTYQWYYNGTPIGGATDSFYVAHQNGYYFVDITLNGCDRLSDVVTIPLYINEIGSGNCISLFPNPSTDQFTIYGLHLSDGATLEIYNVLGEKIFLTPLPPKAELGGEAISVKLFPAGIYFVRMVDERGSYAAKFVKE